MASNSKRNEKRDLVTVSEELAAVPVAEVAAPEVPKEVVAETITRFSSGVSAGVRATIDSAPKGWTGKVRSEKDFDAASAALKSSNPNNLTVVHKPGLGHHSVAVG